MKTYDITDEIKAAVIYMPKLSQYWPFDYFYRKMRRHYMVEAINSGAYIIYVVYGKRPKDLR